MVVHVDDKAEGGIVVVWFEEAVEYGRQKEFGRQWSLNH
jgi:hypothetical protein